MLRNAHKGTLQRIVSRTPCEHAASQVEHYRQVEWDRLQALLQVV